MNEENNKLEIKIVNNGSILTRNGRIFDGKAIYDQMTLYASIHKNDIHKSLKAICKELELHESVSFEINMIKNTRVHSKDLSKENNNV